MSKDDNMKSVFITGEEDVKEDMIEYIQSELGVYDADWYNYCGRYVIEVPKDKYEEVLKAGKEYGVEVGLINCMSWLDYQDEMRYPISSCDIAYGTLPETLLPGEELGENYKIIRRFWCDDEYTPKTLLEYFNAMKKFLDVGSIERHYHLCEEDGGRMIISPNSLDYEMTMKKFKEFIKTYGYGPFEVIKPLSFTGKLIDEPFQYKKTK
ncbi:MAG: hypothetical protein IK137_01430 [Bacilli bacterium]|nr:hypothetical protein [Bacilli bacterium]